MKKSNKKAIFHIPYSIFHSEDGVTIIIAIVLLATISFVSFSLSTVILREIGAARLLQNSEPALAGANSGAEVGLYQYNRGQIQSSIQGNLSAAGASYDVDLDLTDDVFNFSVSDQTPMTVSFFNPSDPNDTDPGVRSIAVTNNGPRYVDITIRSWSDPSASINCDYTSVPAGQTRTCGILIGPDYRYEVEIQRGSGGGGGPTAAGQIEGRTGLNGAGDPVPIVSNTPVFDVTGKLSDIQRRLRVNINP